MAGAYGLRSVLLMCRASKQAEALGLSSPLPRSSRAQRQGRIEADAHIDTHVDLLPTPSYGATPRSRGRPAAIFVAMPFLRCEEAKFAGVARGHVENAPVGDGDGRHRERGGC